MDQSTEQESVVVLDASQVAAARALAAAHDVEVDEAPRLGIEPVTTVTLVLIGTVTGVGSVLHILEQRKGGQVIDLRPGTPKAFYRTPDVVYGTVVIITVDGKVTVEVKEPEGMFGKVIATLPKMLSAGGGTTQVSRTVTTEFGSDVQVETAQTPNPDGAV
ncbi:MAG TPA: hypothetical protein VGG05_25040 [Pseudonocardiaceae bacterium]